MKTTYCIEVENLNFSFDKNVVIEDVSFQITDGQYTGLIGPNGGGKTTLIRIILGLLTPSSGSVRLFGEPANGFMRRYLIGYVPQNASQAEFYFPATAHEIVRSGRTARVGMFRRFTKADNAAITHAMETAGVAHLKDRLIGKLSGGQRQRVFIARALAGDPKVLILDEPAVGVDTASKERFYEFLHELNKNSGITILFVTHDLGVIAREVETVLCLNTRLLCHSDPGVFTEDKLIEIAYGGKVTPVIHGH
ncbi:metal ABC transporter ATP-binding protein [Candidatus Magnetominusculus dajiuhuensis]|uniref:metal ABC transporter ATP-binding protein n=1 Tax=Candidatus Magnetominusculus dajiuhuensis TaxID=3137712 RepID=UPI003B43AC9C